MGEAALQPMAEEIVVYLVDDDRGMVSSTSQWLSLSGLRVRAFADPAALIKVLKQNQPCVIISDIRMPSIDGMELMKLIHSKDKRIPVILITGHGDIPLAVEAMKQGAFEFLQKPFSPEKLLEVAKSAQNQWQDFAALQTISHDDVGEIGQVPEDAEVLENDLHPTTTLTEQVDGFEKELIETALEKHRGAIPKVIAELDIPRRTLNAKMKKYGIFRSSFR
ncbi:MAG: response regulator [Pseudomonadota bacterium]